MAVPGFEFNKFDVLKMKLKGKTRSYYAFSNQVPRRFCVMSKVLISSLAAAHHTTIQQSSSLATPETPFLSLKHWRYGDYSMYHAPVSLTQDNSCSPSHNSFLSFSVHEDKTLPCILRVFPNLYSVITVSHFAHFRFLFGCNVELCQPMIPLYNQIVRKQNHLKWNMTKNSYIGYGRKKMTIHTDEMLLKQLH